MTGEETISLFEAIHLMRQLSAEGKTFSFAHSTYDTSRGISHGIRHVQTARIRPASKSDDLINADHKLFYFDEDLQEPRVCWQVLIMFFQGMQVILN
jgi:hypothetical protein